MEHEQESYTNCDWCFWYSHQMIIKGTGGLGNKKTSGDHPKLNITENGQNTEKSPGDLRRLAVTKTPVKNHQRKTDVKNSQGVNNNNNNNNNNDKNNNRPIVTGAFGTVTKGLLKGLEDLEIGGRVETIQTTAFLKTARILRKVLET